ncbi:hypothetical protein L6164_030698 [Bauhinia variegata]|uniref:Uncharacterized protein n=1 Tax=Bauhinia variegata TaxID=167791 RepID=A0ACB9LE12_BAUVA|nr:hypothetical protein L6164_030698 [Bauhinia variegata]
MFHASMSPSNTPQPSVVKGSTLPRFRTAPASHSPLSSRTIDFHSSIRWFNPNTTNLTPILLLPFSLTRFHNALNKALNCSMRVDRSFEPTIKHRVEFPLSQEPSSDSPR